MPRKPRAELYNALGLQKHGKNMFYRDLLPPAPQQRPFRIAPGIKGMVMLVFDLPSSPTCSRSSRISTRRRQGDHARAHPEQVPAGQQHDRVGRMADTLEYSNVAFPRARFEPELIAEREAPLPGSLEEDGDRWSSATCTSSGA